MARLNNQRVFHEDFLQDTLWQINIDPENHKFLGTNLPTPMTGRVCVNLLEGNPLIWKSDAQMRPWWRYTTFDTFVGIISASHLQRFFDQKLGV